MKDGREIQVEIDRDFDKKIYIAFTREIIGTGKFKIVEKMYLIPSQKDEPWSEVARITFRSLQQTQSSQQVPDKILQPINKLPRSLA